MLRRVALSALLLAPLACADDGTGDASATEGASTNTSTSTSTTTSTSTSSGSSATSTSTSTTSGSTSTTTSTSSTTADETTTGVATTRGTDTDSDTGTSTDTDSDTDTDTGVDPGPDVDLGDPQLYAFKFTAAEADAGATEALGTQLAYLDTTVQPRGRLVVYLHGAGAPTTCGSTAHGQLLAGMGFHVFMPCYRSDYGVGNCGDDIGGCRLEAFEGVDHHPFIDITPPNAIETRVVRGLQHLQALHPGGDWAYYLDGDAPRWDAIILSGISHGASSSGLIGKHRLVDRVVMLSGPLDTGQAWLTDPLLTAIERYYGFTHTGDGQHPGHLQSFIDLGVPGEPIAVDGASPPYGDSHRLITSAVTGDPHGSTQAGGASPKDGDAYVFTPVWAQMYGALP
ncbi:MAG: hypothetical protein R3B09_15030 [Nannocystaceae bacterium]